MTDSKQKDSTNSHSTVPRIDENQTKQGLKQIKALSDHEENFLFIQYSSLRDEVLKRIELQHQLILGTLVAVGSILTVSAQPGAASLLLLYPFLALFLAMTWSQNDHRVREITQHLSLKEEIFLTNPGLGWEHSRRSTRLWFFGSRKVFAARGIFVGSQLLTFLLFWVKVQPLNNPINAEDTILIVVNIFIVLVTIVVIGFPSWKRK